MTWRLAFGAALVGVPAVAPAQEAAPCRMELVRAEVGRSIGINTYGSGGVLFRCIGQSTTIAADSAAWFPGLDRLDFVGSVRFRDSTAALDADRARYYLGDERMDAFGNVQLSNRRTGSTLTGPTLTYYRAVEGIRDSTELYATRRPTVAYRPPGDVEAAPYLIVGDRVRLVGGSAAWAAGAVTIEREAFTASGDSAALDLAAQQGYLVGRAEARGRDATGYRIRGERIAYRLEDDRLTWVQSQGEARALSGEWTLDGDTIEFDIARDLIQGGRAWGDSTRPRATSTVHAIVADSLAIDAPDQLLTEVRGFGRGQAASSTDTTRAEPDLLTGDTIVARFAGAADGRRVVQTLEGRGTATALYHIADERNPSAPAAISYSRGERIVARFAADQVDRVEVVGEGDGAYLEPGGGEP